MSNLSTDRKPLVDYGVQIRFIKDLHDTGGGYSDKSRANSTAAPASNKYGVAVRVQGISGQPYVVLKDGEKGDSYGVQLNTPAPSSGPPSPCSTHTKINKEPVEITKPHKPAVNTKCSPVSAAEDEDGEIFGSPLKRPPGDGQAGIQGEEEDDSSRNRKAERTKAEPQVKATAIKVEKNKNQTHKVEYNEAGLKPVRLNGVEPSRGKANGSGFTGSLRKKVKSTVSQSATTDDQPVPEVDANSLTPINKLISKFNNGTPGSSPQTRGRSGARQRLRFDERRRSRSLDARKDVETKDSLPSPTSPAVNPYAAASSTLVMSSTSLGRSPESSSKMTPLEASKPSFTLPGKSLEKDITPAVVKKPVSTTDCDAGIELIKSTLLTLCLTFLTLYLKEVLPRTLTQNTGAINSEEARVKQAFFNILKDG